MEQPKRFGDYEVLGKLGSGGMGEVYKVRNVISDRLEAMKVLLPDLADRQDLAARFLREIKVLAALHHPNIAALRTALTAENRLVMIMELVEGESLARRLTNGPIPPDEAVRVVDQVLDALEYAHGRTVIHRDIKPANMMVTPQGVVKLTDFGIARSASDHTLTAVGATTGSVAYISPEQIGGGPTDARSDLYSLGVSLYEMVTGQLPFRADSDVAMMFAHLKQDPRPPIELESGVSPALNALVLKAVAKAPEERFQSASEFRAALRSPAGMAYDAAGTQPTGFTLPAAAPGAVASASAGVNPAATGPSAAGSDVAGPGVAVPTVPPIPPLAAMANTPGSHIPPTAPPPVPGGARPSQPLPPPRRVQGGVSPIIYVVLGAVLVIALVGGMAYYSRLAEARPPVVTETPTPPATDTTPSPAVSTTPAPPPDAPPAPPAGPSADPSRVASETPPAPSSAPAPAGPAASVASPPANAATTASAKRVRPATAEPAPAVDSGARPARPSDRDAARNAAAAEAAKLEEALDQLELELDQLSARVTAINGTIDRLKSEQASMGLGLRGDVAARQQTMNVSMAKAADALERRDLARAQRFKALAETDLQELQKFVGR